MSKMRVMVTEEQPEWRWHRTPEEIEKQMATSIYIPRHLPKELWTEEQKEAHEANFLELREALAQMREDPLFTQQPGNF